MSRRPPRESAQDPAQSPFPAASEHPVEVGESVGTVTGLLLRPPDADWLFVLAHGAGTDMRHRQMEATARALAAARIATFRFNFPYKEHGRGAPDRPPAAVATVRAAVRTAAGVAPGLPLLAGGRSFGGRMTSTAASQSPLPGVKGLVFYGFPLHPSGSPGTERAAHLADVTLPMLFLQGANDTLAGLDLLRPVVKRLGQRATLHVVEHADHSFHVPRRSGRTDEDVLSKLAHHVHDWATSLQSAGRT